MYERRKQAQKSRITSHGEASQYFVTFLDNHDNHDFRFAPISQPGMNFDLQFALGFGSLLALQGIPCIYYGTEQGLTGMGPDTGDAGVREALWGKPNAFDRAAKHYGILKELLELRSKEPSLRYGRQYFRPVSGDNKTFSISPFENGVLAFSRVLNDREIVIILNPNATDGVRVNVLVDNALNPENSQYKILYSNSDHPTLPGKVALRQGNDVEVFEIDGRISRGGPVKSVPAQLGAMEIQIISV
jgi:glycosidase